MQRFLDRVEFNDHNITVHWKDGSQNMYALLDLRIDCPCANCRGGHGIKDRKNRTTGNIKDIKLISWKKVGRYALRLTWSDGHDAGIYTLDGLADGEYNIN